MNKRKLGGDKEKTAADYLAARGIEILETNYRCRIGEIDIIGKEGDTYVFLEVKFRASDTKGAAAEAVGLNKQKKICRVSDHFRMMNKLNEFTSCRFDVIAIDADRIDWIKNAFPYIYR